MLYSGEDSEEELYVIPTPNPPQSFYTTHPYTISPTSEILGIHDTLPHANPTQNPSQFSTLFYKNNILSPDQHHHIQYPLFLHELSSNTPSDHSNNSNSMEVTVDTQIIANENENEAIRRKRLISNRESARRTRVRRKEQIQELQSQKNNLTATNQHLTEQLMNLLQCINRVFQENSQLKEEISFLHRVLANQQTTPLSDDPEEVARCIIRPRAEGLNPSILNSMNLRD